MSDRSLSAPADESEREEILGILADSIRETKGRIEDYDVVDHDDEQLLIRWTRTLGYLSGQYRKLMKDTDIDEMEEDLGLLKAATDVEDEE